MTKEVFAVPDVHCDNCVNSIEGAVGSLAGVGSVKVDLAQRDVTVEYDDSSVTRESIIETIVDQGYDVGESGNGLIQITKHHD